MSEGEASRDKETRGSLFSKGYSVPLFSIGLLEATGSICIHLFIDERLPNGNLKLVRTRTLVQALLRLLLR